MTPAAVNPGNEIYDPYGQHDSYIPGMDMLGQYDEPDVRNGHQTPPPPPPLHSRSYQEMGAIIRRQILLLSLFFHLSSKASREMLRVIEDRSLF